MAPLREGAGAQPSPCACRARLPAKISRQCQGKQRERGREDSVALGPPRKGGAREVEKEISWRGLPRDCDLSAQEGKGFKGTLGVAKRSQAVGDYIPFP